MSKLREFLALEGVKGLLAEGKKREVARLAISMGTINKDKELRSYGFTVLSKLEDSEEL